MKKYFEMFKKNQRFLYVLSKTKLPNFIFFQKIKIKLFFCDFFYLPIYIFLGTSMAKLSN